MNSSKCLLETLSLCNINSTDFVHNSNIMREQNVPFLQVPTSFSLYTNDSGKEYRILEYSPLKTNDK